MIIENTISDYIALRRWVGEVFPEATIVTGEDEVFSNWDKAFGEIKSRTPPGPDLVLFLDLALIPTDVMEPREAAETAARVQVPKIRALRPEAVIITYTQFSELAADGVDGVLAKSKLDDSDEKTRLEYIRRTVGHATLARRARLGAPSGVKYELDDSLGIRMAEAVFGQRLFESLVYEIAREWSGVRIRALNSGHSGAVVLLLTGVQEGQTKGLVVKCAREAAAIEYELKALVDHLADLGPLGAHCVPMESRPNPLPYKLGFYYRQSHLSGDTLLDLFLKTEWNEESRRSLDFVTSLELRQHADKVPLGRRLASEKFQLTDLDKERAKQSLRTLGNFASVLTAQGQWPHGIPDAGGTITAISAAIENWDNLMKAEGELFHVAQHGDLNPGNAIVDAPGRGAFIDLARLGLWPAGYDLCRLATMFRLRLTCSKLGRDWIVNELSAWCQDQFCQIDADVQADQSRCPPATYCDQAFRQFVVSRPEAERRSLERGYLFGTLWDLLKVLSYGDLAPCKRVWALVVCGQLMIRLGL
jgi:hypothetical protein